MRILFFSRNLSYGGSERVLSNLSNELASLNYEVVISLNDDCVFYNVHPNIKLIIAPSLRYGQWNNPFCHFISWIERNHRNYRHTRNTINAMKPDLIVSFSQCNMKAILCCHGNIPIIHSEHNAYDRKLGFKSYFNRFFLNRFFDKVCVLTLFDSGYARAKGLKNAVVMPNPNTFPIITENEYADLFYKRKNLLVCGRVDAWNVKGFDIAIEAFSIIAKQYPDVDLDIAGYGNENSIKALCKIADNFGVVDRIHFLGKRTDIKDVYQKHSLLLLSSRTEGFPMVVTEAMSQGLPCVSFERLSYSIIINDIDGMLVNNLDVAEMSVAVKRLLDDDKRRFSLGKEARKNIERFSSSSIARKWESLFHELIVKRNEKGKKIV